jgi:hypothetical protein
MVDEVAKVVASTAASVTADVAKVSTFWSKYGTVVTHVLTAFVAGVIGHKL